MPANPASPPRRPRRPGSLQIMLAWRLAAVMLVAVALAAGAVAWRSLRTARTIEHAALRTRALAIAEAVVPLPDGRLVLRLPAPLRAAYIAAEGRNLYVVHDLLGRLIAQSSPGAAALLAPYLPRRPGYFRVPPGPGFGHGMIGLVLRDDRVEVAVAGGHEPQELLVASLSQDLVLRGFWLILAIGAVAVAIGVLTIRRGLAPLRRASAIAGRIGPEDPRQRLPDEDLPREVRPLILAVNRALARLEEGLERQRRFAADAAHQLRTPLAVLTARLDAIEGEQARALAADVERMNRLVDQMLKLARLDAVALDTSARVDLHAVALEVVEQLAPLAIAGGREIVLSEVQSHSPVRGNRWALAMALANLVENALAHSPPGAEVEIAVAPGSLEVRDRGPGVPEAERASIFRRFATTRAHSAGAGLGLAIVAGIAAAHDGSVEVADRAGGGATFTFRVGKSRILG